MHYGFGGIGMIAIWIAVIAIIAVLVKSFLGSARTGESRSSTPLEILKKRYASGEITRDEFEEKKTDLRGI
jgi:putative membrane protein